jgi:SHS2 domain-containing protein
MEEAFEQLAISMFNYMTELERVEVKQVYHVVAEGHDMQSLLFHFLDELLFMFCAEPFLVAKVYIMLPRTLFDDEKPSSFVLNFPLKAM